MPDDDDLNIRLPLLAALIDDDPDTTTESRQSFRTQARQIKETVRRDLQDLLNTRQRALSWPKEFTELDRSVLDYGIVDVTGANLASNERRNAFLAQIAAAIRKHDPRFQSVVITPTDNSDPQDRTLRFRIEATLRVETGPETAIFNFQLEPVSRRFE
ncbi:MAG: type VI secretion system baseplate subunit TssE [Planctomycetes bacterium]|nr:type VI secretion system baseplate subunit TssE [Planctomycetota bacterium]